MRRSSKLIAAACGLALLSGCSGASLVYNRLDTLVRFQIGRYVDLDKTQRAAFDTGFDAFWRWHRSTQLPRYAQSLRELSRLTSSPIDVATVTRLDEQVREHVDAITLQAMPLSAATLASLSDAQVDDLLANTEKRAAEERKKQQKLDDAKWRKKRLEDAADRLDDWTGSVTPAQRDRIAQWVQAQARPADDPEAEHRQAFGALLRGRHEAGFEHRLQDYVFEPFTGEAARRNEPATQAGRQLLADLSASLTADQRSHLQHKLETLATELDQLSVQPD